MGVKCELSPLVFRELYGLLPRNGEEAGSLLDRLRQIERDLEWLDEAVEDYGRKWAQHRELIRSGATPPPLAEDHALLASWLLAALLPFGSSHDLSSDLSSAVTARVAEESPELLNARPRELSPAVIGWTLGLVVPNDLDPALPVVPATALNDRHTAAAYAGLVEHVTHLGRVGEPWPEMVSTSIVLRGAGMVEALRSNEGSPGDAIKTLLRETRRSIPDRSFSVLDRYWSGLASPPSQCDRARISGCR